MGGPLVRDSDDTLVGISFYGGISPGKPQTFTNIHSHFDWISNKTRMDLPKC